eukprot:TRINITY_DN1465_c0_g1_i1.p1 TRINITY_DN1465_c0_g1~~TRINITY_DN1465_c0_g1_i1.p1  ORF type:complete len:924 (+),score=263.09 TRINITY_DN1465_c0_g1_i1:77-2848(+)
MSVRRAGSPRGQSPRPSPSSGRLSGGGIPPPPGRSNPGKLPPVSASIPPAGDCDTDSSPSPTRERGDLSAAEALLSPKTPGDASFGRQGSQRKQPSELSQRRGSALSSFRGSNLGAARPPSRSTQERRAELTRNVEIQDAFIEGGDDDDDDDDDQNPFGKGMQSLSPSSPMGALQRRGSSVYQRNTADHIDDVKARRQSMMKLKQIEMEAKAREADERREQAKADKFDRPKRELLGQRTLLWLQVMCAISVPGGLTQGAAETRAKHQLTVLWLPMVRRWRMLRRKRRLKSEYISACEAQMADLRLEPNDLKKIDFFEDWRPYNLEKLIEAMVPDAFRAGDYIMMEGDWGMEMYVIAKGAVEIVIRKPAGPGGVKKKSRSKQDGLVVATLTESSARRFFGEFSVLCHEPRTASVVAATDIMLWRIGKKDIDAQLDLLPPSVREKVLKAADHRRTQNMAKLFPLKGDKLTKAPEGACPLFQCYPVGSMQLTEIVNKFEPRVVRPNTTLFEQGDQGDLFYFIASGEVEIRKRKPKAAAPAPASPPPKRQQSLAGAQPPPSPRGGAEARQSTSAAADDDRRGSHAAELDPSEDMDTVATLSAGCSFGEVALIFLETRTATAVATQSSDLWVLKKDDLLMFLMSMPDWFVEAKKTINRVRASWLPPSTIELWHADSMLAKLTGPRFFRDAVGVMEPRVIDRSVDIVQSGSDIDHIILVVEGVVRHLRSSDVYHGPVVFGVPDVLTFQPKWFHTLKAERRCDCWLLPKVDFFQIMKRHHPDVLQRAITKEFQEQVSDQFKMPFQPWEDKLAEHARCTGAKRPQTSEGRGQRLTSPQSARKQPSPLNSNPGSPRSARSGNLQSPSSPRRSASPGATPAAGPLSPGSPSVRSPGGVSVPPPRSPATGKRPPAAASGGGRGAASANVSRGTA